jgi:predicted transposase/invertase (TIGR01784 family)
MDSAREAGETLPMAQTPHDLLFKQVFSRPREAASFLSAHLPADVSAAIDWSRLTPVKSSFEDVDGAQSHADLVFSAPLSGAGPDGTSQDIQIAILFEHQSTPDTRMPLRLLGYIVRTMERQLASGLGARAVPVIPVVLYHGAAPWPVPTRLSNWLGLSDAHRALLAPYLPDFEHVLEERRPPLPEAYRGTSQVRWVRLLLDHRLHPDLETLLEAWGDIMRELEAGAGDQFIHSILAYTFVYVYHQREDARGFVAAFDRLGANKLKEIAMNAADKLREEGRLQGLAEGEARGETKGMTQSARDILLRLLSRRFGALPPEVTERIEAAERATLLGWTDAVLTAATLDEVFLGPLS